MPTLRKKASKFSSSLPLGRSKTKPPTAISHSLGPTTTTTPPSSLSRDATQLDRSSYTNTSLDGGGGSIEGGDRGSLGERAGSGFKKLKKGVNKVKFAHGISSPSVPRTSSSSGGGIGSTNPFEDDTNNNGGYIPPPTPSSSEQHGLGSSGHGGGFGGMISRDDSATTPGVVPTPNPHKGAFTASATMGMVPSTIATSAGVHRLNRILDQTPQSRVSYVPEVTTAVESSSSSNIHKGTKMGNGYGSGERSGRSSFANAVKSLAGGDFSTTFDNTSYDDHHTHAHHHSHSNKEHKVKPEDLKVSNPQNEEMVGDVICLACPKQHVDVRSIGGYKVHGDDGTLGETNILLSGNNSKNNRDENEESSRLQRNSKKLMNIRRKKGKDADLSGTSNNNREVSQKELIMKKLQNECLLCLRVGKFEISGGTTTTTSNSSSTSSSNTVSDSIKHVTASGRDLRSSMVGQATKARNKLRFVAVVRSTNRPLLKKKSLASSVEKQLQEEEESDDPNENDDDSDDGYDKMFSPDPEEDGGEDEDPKEKKKKKKENDSNNKDTTSSSSDTQTKNDTEKNTKKKEEGGTMSPEDEISSFPSFIVMALHSDGTNPDLRRIVPLNNLVTVDSRNDGTVLLMFRTGEVIEVDCAVSSSPKDGADNNGEDDKEEEDMSSESTKTRKERFLWSLLQIHAILCTSVMERTSGVVNSASSSSAKTGVSAASLAPPSVLQQLIVRNIDRAELQYVSTVNGFLSDSAVLMALLNRQSLDRKVSQNRLKGGSGGGGGGSNNTEEEDGDKLNAITGGAGGGETPTKLSITQAEQMDGMAYDMMMGNYTRYAIFASDEERTDAEEVLNAISWQQQQQQQQEITSDGGGKGVMTTTTPNTNVVDAATTAENLAKMLQKRMRDLEAETCRRLIAWEDEKHYSMSNNSSNINGPKTLSGLGVAGVTRDTVDALSLATLFSMLDELDEELEKMEGWLEDKAAAIKPLTDDCRDIEEENRQLEQQWKSYEMLGSELRRLLSGLEVPQHLERVLANPGSVLSYDPSGAIDVDQSEDGVELIHEAGQALKAAMDRVTQEGGVHLIAVSDRVKGLAQMAGMFCSALAQIVVTVMEQLADDVSGSEQGKVTKGDSHTVVAKKIRDTQRRFQSSLLSYIKLIEVLALLKPSILPAIRDAYSELVAEVIMNKKRMKGYFSTLPGKTSKTMESVTNDLKEYSVVTLRSDKTAEVGSANMKPVNMQDIQAALSEMLPVIAREAYFTAALFGLSTRHADGREKKRNFESAKRSVDHSSQYFRYYMSRICGIASEADAEGKKVSGDPMLSLVASIHLNEAMDGYIDRQKKGGDHSLSLAYVRATILDLRKKVDKQWAAWVEDQIKWIKTNPGVPPNGKRAGIFTSFARFPCYLDHVMTCCKSGRSKEYTPKLAKIKVVSYYLQKMAGALFSSLQQCAERETTDKQYAANVMRMENSYFFTQSIKQRGNEMTTLFAKQITAASSICKQSTDAYLGWMIKREFKALHSLFSNISRIRRDVGDADVPIHVPRATFVKTLQKESNRDVMKEKIGIIYARMEKHLSEAGGLLPVAWKALVKVLYEWFGRWEKLSTQCYKFVLEPSAVDVVRIAKAAGGSATRMGISREKSSGNAATSSSGRHRLGLAGSTGRRPEAEC